MDNLKDLKDKIVACRDIEKGIWNYIHQDTQKYLPLLREHAKLESIIHELYREIGLMGKEHALFEHVNTANGKKIVELLRALKIRLSKQYADLIDIDNIVKQSNKIGFTDQELIKIRAILDGEKNGLNESENSQTIKKIELEIDSLITSNETNMFNRDEAVKVSVNGKDIIVEKWHSEKNMRFNQSLELIKSKGYTRHLMPNELFELLKNKNNVFNFTTEWVNMFVKVTDGKLYVAFNPARVNHTYNEFDIIEKFDIVGSYESFNIPLGKLRPGYYTDHSDFPEELKKFVGPFCKKIHLRDTANREGWCPVACQSDFSGGPNFTLIADHGQCASRGVK